MLLAYFVYHQYGIFIREVSFGVSLLNSGHLLVSFDVLLVNPGHLLVSFGALLVSTYFPPQKKKKRRNGTSFFEFKAIRLHPSSSGPLLLPLLGLH